MFDFYLNEKNINEYSEMKFREKAAIMSSLKTNVLNCPGIIKGMSHEMRTHLNAIIAFSFLMKENGCSDTDKEEFSNQILSSSEQLLGLFDSFLDTALTETAYLKSDSIICKLDNLFDDLIYDLQENFKKAGNDEVELIIDIPPTISAEVEVQLCKHKIFKILSCLFNNSLKNTISGFIKIGFYLSEEKLTFYVLDSGQCYSKYKEFLNSEDLNVSLKIHDDTPAAINLTLARKLIQMMAGTIWIESNNPNDTGIYFSVPVKYAEIGNVNLNEFNNTLIVI